MDKVAGKLTKVICRSANNSSKTITFETANLAKFADGSCICSLGDTSVLVTAVCQSTQKSSGSNFLPLIVDYRQKAAAAGRIPMTHLRREIGVTEKEILTSRMIDRSIRPAFTKGFYYDTAVTCNLLAVDGVNEPDVLAINGASASLSLSDIPWNGPIGAVRMGLIGGSLIVNPSRREQENSRLNLVLSANRLGNVMMMDGSCKEPVLMPDLLKATRHGIKECQAVVESILKLQKSCGKPKRSLDLTSYLPTDEQLNFISSQAGSQINSILTNASLDKLSRDEAMTKVRVQIIDTYKDKFPSSDTTTMNDAFSQVVRSIYRQILNETKIRCDGRQLDELRPISCEVDLYKPLHGSALFQRGQTQVFCSSTFDSPDAAFRSDSMTVLLSGIKEKNFMLHYDFPKYATNEIGKISTMPGRREIGHGALAEKSIRPLVPNDHEMTIRLNCEVLESNGSSSMASVCAGSLSLMDAGVDIKEHVAGVAIGLISNFGERSDSDVVVSEPKESSDYLLLTDILGFEDYIGDMDFKIAGTKKAITGFMLDLKLINGLPATVLYKAIQKAHNARVEIINIMDKVIRSPRKEKKENHPVIKTIHIPPHKKAKFIGFGGANLKKLAAQIGVRISSCDDSDAEIIGETARDNFIIFAPNKDAMQEAEEFIKTLLEKGYKEPELDFNGIYTATIQEIRPNGVMVTLYSNMTPTLLPLSQLDVRTVRHPSALNLEVGQQIQVKYFGRDPATGQMRLSRKSLLMSGVARVQREPAV